MAFNRPQMRDNKGNNKMRRWIHQPLHIDHFDIHVEIYGGEKSGKVKFTKPVKGSDEYDEIELPVSLIYKMADLLSMTRKAEYVSVTEVPKEKLEEMKKEGTVEEEK